MICPHCQRSTSSTSGTCEWCRRPLREEAEKQPSTDRTPPVATRFSSAEPATQLSTQEPEEMPPTRLVITPASISGALAPQTRKPIFGWLVVVEGPDQWLQLTIPTEDSRWIIGSSQECGMRIRAEDVAPQHASLRMKDGALQLTDLDSGSGTYVREQEITRAELNDGDVIRMGSVRMKFRKL